jgi:hypothetical protein
MVGHGRILLADRCSGRLRHCEEQSDEAIQVTLRGLWIASLRSQ